MAIAERRYPTDVEERITLDADVQVRFRALRTNEEAPIRELYERLGMETRYFRFLSPMPSLPDAVVRGLASVDYRHSLAIVVERDVDAHEVIGLASFCAVDEEVVELGIVVQDDWQLRGIGTALVESLLGAAERRGYRKFAASIALGNVAMRKILNRFGRVVASKTSSGVSELVFVRRDDCLSDVPSPCRGPCDARPPAPA